MEVHLLDRAADTDRCRIVVAPGRVEHDRVVAHRAAHGFADLDVFLPLRRRMDLVGRPAVFLESQRLIGIGLRRGQHRGTGIGGNGFAIGPQQTVDRLAHRLAQEIPQRDVDGTDGAHAARPLLLPQVLDHGLAMQRIAAHQYRLQVGDESLPVRRRRIGSGAQESVPLEAFVRDDPQQTERAGAREAAVCAVGGRRNVVPGEKRQRDVGDFHGAVSQTRRSLP